MPTLTRPASRRLRLASAASLLAASIVLTGCSQVAGIVEQLLPERSGAHTLVVGECFNDTVAIVAAEGEVVDVPRENCTLDHDNEVIASVQLEGETFPGDDAVTMRAFEECLAQFEEFIGVGFEQAGTLKYDFFTPSAASWAHGDREILCFVYDSAGQTAYSLKGAGTEAATAAPDSEDQS